MQPYVETAIQWLRDTIRCNLRGPLQGLGPSEPGEWVDMCWDIGHSLAMMQAHDIPVRPVIEAVSSQLRQEFSGVRGLRPRDFQQMRVYYLNYFERPQLLPKLREVAWDQHAYILDTCKDPQQQEFYLSLCMRESLNLAGLAKAIRTQRFEMSATIPWGTAGLSGQGRG
jgi:hypothetical protein